MLPGPIAVLHYGTARQSLPSTCNVLVSFCTQRVPQCLPPDFLPPLVARLASRFLRGFRWLLIGDLRWSKRHISGQESRPIPVQHAQALTVLAGFEVVRRPSHNLPKLCEFRLIE